MDDVEIAALTERVLSLPPAEQMGFVLGMLEKVSDERDGWKATVTRMMEDEEALIAERDRRLAELAHARTGAVVANNAVDTATEAVGSMAAKLTAVLTEQNRLRAAMDGVPVLVERTVRMLQQNVGRDLAADPDTIRDAVTAALAAVKATDG